MIHVFQIHPVTLFFIVFLSFLSANLLADERRYDCVLDNNPTVINSDEVVWQKWFQKAEKYQILDRYHNAIEALHQALKKTSDPAHRAMTWGSLGYACFMLGKKDEAAKLLGKSATALESKGRETENPEYLGAAAVALNNLGNLCATYRKTNDETTNDFKNFCADKTRQNKALDYYDKSVRLANQAVLAVKAKMNWVQTALKASAIEFNSVKNALLFLLIKTHEMKSSQEKIPVLLRLGRLIRLTYRNFPSAANPFELRLKAFNVFKEALALSQKYDDTWGKSQALGYLGQLYFDETGCFEDKHCDNALKATRRAIFLAEASPDSEILAYYWHWQMGKIFKKQDNNYDAILAYRQAVNALWAPSIRYDLAKIYRIYGSSFREQVGTLFLEFIEVLLEESTLPLEKQKRRCHFQHQAPCLREAQDTLEKLKAAELFDYFQEECVIKDQQELTQIALGTDTAVLYPILFEDRLELLLHKQDKIIRKTVNSRTHPDFNLDKTVEKLLYELALRRNYESNDFLIYAKKLYDWLIRPFKEDNQTNHLDGINTLVFVPDGILRTIPLGVLHDGKNYLITQHAIAMVPGLTLREMTAHSQPKRRSLLLIGLNLQEAIPIQGRTLEALDTIEEIKNIKESIQHTYSKTVELLNDQFTDSHLESELSQTAYSHVHLASHVVVEADIKKSFILAGNEQPLFLERFEDLLLLNRTHESSLNLITLSACDTALGDERAALGLGGVALRAGAQSAVATLWKAHAWFASQFMPHFYKKISQGLPKAEALQEAQVEIITNPKTSIGCPVCNHPYFWGSFILIGNWL